MVRIGPAYVLVWAALGCGSGRPVRDDAAPKRIDAVVARDAPLSDAAPIDAAPARTEHAVFELVPNRHAAHRVVGGEAVIDAGDVGFARFTRFGVPAVHWKLGRLVDGQRAAIADRLASIEVPLAAEQAEPARQIAVRVHGQKGLVLAVRLNGRKPSGQASVALVDGWQTVAFPVDPRRFVVGENQLAFETTGKPRDGRVAFAWLRVGAATSDADRLARDPRAAATFDGKADAIALADGAALVWYTTLPEGANLVADVAPGCRIEVTARASDASVAGGILAGSGARVDLSSAAGKVVGLVLAARDCPSATIAHPRITLHGDAPAMPAAIVPPKYVVVWVMDAARADRIPLFTPGARAQTPTLDELAKTGAVFRQFYVQGNESQTSHSSLWTGTYPAVHGVRLAGSGGVWQIDRRFPIVSSELHDSGFATVAVTGNGFVTVDGGYGRGFDVFRNLMREPGATGYIPGERLVGVALAQLDAVSAHRTHPAYLFLGTIDTHFPWVPHAPWIDRYSPPPYRGKFGAGIDPALLGLRADAMHCTIVPPPDELERLRAIYDSDLSYQDAQLDRVVKQLKSWGIWDQTLLVVTADHGEELFEEGRCGHGASLRESLVRVPLLLHYPAGVPATIVDEGAEAIDVLPTIDELVGRTRPMTVQGRSLLAQARGVGKTWAQPSYASMYEYAHAMRIGRWKIRVGPAGAPIIDDVVEDPQEAANVAATHPVERRMLTDNLGAFLALRAVWNKGRWGVTTNVTAEGAASLDEVQP